MLSSKSFAQKHYTLSGYIKDLSSGEDLIGASVYVPSLEVGATSNTYGFFSLTIPEGNYKFQFRYIGFESIIKEIQLDQDIQMSFSLNSSTQDLDEVVISASKNDNQHITDTKTGIVKINPSELRSVPIIFGEQDIIKTLQLESGVKAGTEGMAGMYVRGGKGDQNLVLLDEAPVYNVAHAAGLFSVFNSDAIKDATLIKGNFPSNYGGRLSSVLDIKMKEGNNQRFQMEGGIGLISSRLTIEAPIVKGKSSFMISGRRSYLDILAKPFMESSDRDNGFYFYDLNAKVNTWLGDKDRIFISGYFGRDVFTVNDNFGLNWGNKTATIRWNHLYNKKLFSNVSLIFSKYDYKLSDDNEDMGEDAISLSGGIEDINLKTTFQYFLNPKVNLKFGVDGILHQFHPGQLPLFNEGSIEANRKLINAFESGIFLTAKIDLLPNLKIEPGFRYSNFAVLGPFETKVKYEGLDMLSNSYKSGQVVKLYHSPEPRFTANYTINENNSLKLAYSRNKQFYHILQTTSGNNPMDIWYPATQNIKPSFSDQYLLGYYNSFANHKWEASAEVYYKNFEGIKELGKGTDVFTESLEPNILEGRGYAYGIEFSLKKQVGKLSGWVNYTYSRVWHQVDELNNGKKYPGSQDRPHDISLVLMYKPSKRLEFGALWTYQTGQVYTQMQRRYFYEGHSIPMYSDINGNKFDDYHRFDFNMTYYPKRTKNRRWKQYWTFSVYNVYARHNTFLLYYENEYDGNNKITKDAKSISIFQFIPSITYNFKF